jgi:hypothetical protein
VFSGHYKHPDIMKEDRIKTCLSKYGVDNPIKNIDVKNKAKSTIFNRYGVDNPFSSEVIKSKIRYNNLLKYGYEYNTRDPIRNLKSKLTLKARYGTDCAFKSLEIRNKGKLTNLIKYGFEYSSQSREVRLKAENTNLIKYGVRHAAQNREIALRSAANCNKCTNLTHWKTSENLYCIGSWEAKVIAYLNNHKIDFIWQPMAFKLPNGKIYLPDLYLIKENKYVEIKGYFRNDALYKWECFHSSYSNSELWNKEKLKSLGIL